MENIEGLCVIQYRKLPIVLFKLEYQNVIWEVSRKFPFSSYGY